MGTEGDSFFVVFARASDAVAAAVAAQRSLADEGWPSGVRVTPRIGLHTGAPARHGEGYVGLTSTSRPGWPGPLTVDK